MSQLNDCQLAYYQANGATSNELQDASREFLIAAGIAQADIMDMWSAYFSANGYTGIIPDDWVKFWIDTGCINTEGALAMLLKTGQTISYFPGDDGDLQAGIARSYTLLDTGQYAGITAITINGNTDNQSNNCIMDNNTGLMWMRFRAQDVGASANGVMLWEGVDNESIFDYKDQANVVGLAGWNNWKIPNIRELESIALVNGTTAVPDPTYWPGFTASDFASSTVEPGDTLSFLRYHFGATLTNGVPKATYPIFLLMCRDA